MTNPIADTHLPAYDQPKVETNQPINSPGRLRRLRLTLPAVIFLISFAVRITPLLGVVENRYHLDGEICQVARNILQFHAYVDPYKESGDARTPTGHVTPGYTFIVTAMYALFKPASHTEMAVHIMTCLISSFAYALLPYAATSFGLSRSTGAAAGIIGALLPIHLRYEEEGSWDVAWTALLFLLLSCSTVRAWRARDASSKWSLLNGLGWGVTLLFSATMGPVLAATLAARVYIYRNLGARNCAISCTLTAAAAALMLSPWVIRNELVFHQLVLTRTNFGLELAVSNNDLATSTLDFDENKASLTKFHPGLSVSEAHEVRRLGEIEYNRRKLHFAIAWIRSQPKRFALLTLVRIREFWFLRNPKLIKSLLPALITLLGWVGLLSVRRKQPEAFLFFMVSIVSYSSIYYFIQISSRYRYPIDWVFLLFSVVACRPIVIRIRALLNKTLNQAESVADQESGLLPETA